MLHRMKSYTTMYFAIQLLFYGVALAIFGETTLPLIVLLELALLGLASALLRIVLIPCNNLPSSWVVLAFLSLSVVISILFAALFGWFAALPVGVFVFYGLYVALTYAGELLLKD